MYYFLTNGYMNKYNRLYHSIHNYNSFEIYKIFVLNLF